MGSVLIQNGTIVTASDVFEGDVYIEGEKIKAVGKGLDLSADKKVDVKGCYVMPGGIDAHTHMELPFMGTFSSDTFESGTRAGLHGGTTTIIDFAIQTQGDSLGAAINQWHEKAGGKAVGDYAFHCAVTDFNEKTKAEVKSVVEDQGITSFKTFMAYKGALMIDDRQIIELFEEIKKHGGILTTHAENGDLADVLIAKNLAAGNTAPRYHVLSRPPICEAEASGRIIDLAYSGNHPLYIVHMTCEEALNRVRLATQRNQKVFVETCVQYLLLDDSLYFQDGFEGSKYVMSPPLRKKKDQEALWSGIEQNIVHTVATDHCPFCMDQKELGKDNFSKIPNGAPGVEHRMELMFSEGVLKRGLSLNKYVDITSTAPARIFGLLPKKGTIAVDADADIIILDPNEKHKISAKTHHMNCDYSAYEGWEVQGKIRSTFLRGNLVIDQGKEDIEKGQGQYLKRNCFQPELNRLV